MKGGKKPLGYTVIEVMIVLAVSGLLLLISLNYIDGKQGKTSFQQGSNEMPSRIQSVIDDVRDGEYTDIAFTCNVSVGALTFTPGPPPSTGDEARCVYLGKIIHFDAGSPNRYEVFSLAGARETAPGVPATNLTQANVTPIISGVNLTKEFSIPQGLDLSVMSVTPVGGGPNTAARSIGFLIEQGTTDAATDTFRSGAANIYMVSVSRNPGAGTIGAGETQATAAGKITAANIQVISSACIGLSDGNRGVRILLGEEGSQFKVRVRQLGEALPTCP